ncbi:MAG TPA: hypothetical protein VH853_15125 [Polyangia bacterium]|jgi:hypothetical protein|nr:hypothetical protein [Polyangia bacterium]
MTDKAPPDRAAGDAAGVVDEFAHIPHSRGRHPVVAVAGALLAFFLVFHVRHDLRYALSSGAPLELGRASAVFGSGRALTGLENRYVRVTGLPDRESALQIDTKGSWVFSQLFRVLGTGDRLFLHRRESPLPAALAEADVFEGRLIRVDELPFAASIRGYFSTHVAATHFFAPEALGRALAERKPGVPLTVVDTSGDPVALDERETIAVDVTQPDEVKIGLPRDRFATEDDARAALASRGGQVLRALGAVKAKPSAAAPEAGPLSSTPEPTQRWTFVVKFPVTAAQAALDTIGNLDQNVEIRDARQTIEVKLEDVSLPADGRGVSGGLVVRPGEGPPRHLDLSTVAAIHTMAPVVIPDDAYLLVEGDRPREHAATVLIALILVMFGAVNLIGLARELSRSTS